MRHVESGSVTARPAGGRYWTALCWASLVPLLFILRPYTGIVQDARIYLGRGLADLDPAGIGRDVIFATDGQTGFTATRPVLHALLAAFPPDRVSAGAAAVGLLAWLAAAAALLRAVAGGRAAWAAAVALLVLPAGYGTSGGFNYAEAIATPRIFAEAAVLAGLAALVSGRTVAAGGLLLLAAACHPLMAVPGIALAALLWLPRAGRAGLLAAAGVVFALLAAAAAGAPLLDRLFTLMDPVWLGVVRHRSTYLFPSQWPPEAFDTVAVKAAAAMVAAGLLDRRGPRRGTEPGGGALLRGAVVVAAGGLLVAAVSADLVPSVLLLQAQPWRALWVLAVLGNAGLAIAAVELWRGPVWGRIVLALLVLAWSTTATPVLSMPSAIAAVGLRWADARGALPAVSARVGWAALAGAVLLAAAAAVGDAVGVFELLAPLGSAWLAVAPWPYVVGSGVLIAPVLALAVALALAPAAWASRAPARALGIAAVVALSIGAAALWDARTPERRMVDARDGGAVFDTALGPGEGGVLWIDDESAAWFLARRPVFFSAVQGAPTLFSRALALAWSERAARLEALGLVQEGDVAPWSPDRPADRDIVPSADAITAFCADPRRPAGIVAPGQHLAAVPPGLPARLWRPPAPVRRLARDGQAVAWRTIDVYTVVSCRPLPENAAVPPA